MNEALETLQIQKSYISSMMKQLEFMEHTIQQNTLARDTLEGLKGKDTGTEILVPIGAATKAFVTLQDISRVIVDIGSGVEMEMPLEEAIEHHQSLVTKLTEEKIKLQEKLRELEQSTAALSQSLERAYAEQMQRRQMPQTGHGENLFNQ